MKGKRFRKRGWRSCKVRDPYRVSLQKAISKEWVFFNSTISFVIGDGSRVKFWKDIWCSEEPLSEMFPNLFALIEAKEATVAYLWEQREGGSLELPFCKESK